MVSCTRSEVSPWNPGRSTLCSSQLDFAASSESSRSLTACMAISRRSTRESNDTLLAINCCCLDRLMISATARSSEKIQWWFLRTQRWHGSSPVHLSFRCRHSTQALEAYFPRERFCACCASGLELGAGADPVEPSIIVPSRSSCATLKSGKSAF